MKIAIEGCMHGDLDNVYKTIQHYEQIHNTKVDLLLCCGDFQAVRNEKDMDSLNVPRKYREMKSFWKYYSGQEVAPIPTIFIGGNHEASNYLWELYYGGWAATNIYFLGFAGVVKFGNVRIGGLSGIYNERHYRSGHFERPPYNESTIRSVYHVRDYDVQKLMQLEEPLDIFLSHDWPVGITDYGDSESLMRQKPYFRQEIEEKTLGSKPAALLLEKLKPQYWFSAHLHCKFAAAVQHGNDGSVTKFLALDKCLPGKKFLQIIEIESEPGPFEVLYDEEWLAITRKFNSIFPLTRRYTNVSTAGTIQESREWVRKKLEERQFKPFEFARTVPAYNPSQRVFDSIPEIPQNPQTLSLLELLGLPYLLDSSPVTGERTDIPASLAPSDLPTYDSEEIPIDDIDEIEEMEEAKADDHTRDDA
ncbi:Lariat debranching enzyme [Arabidopsis thaliana]|jgi:lariat debranching enzyme|uniref:Lariat debranching enzyme n=5 Tax=Arabidopsis TaxID=3701 RepID=DBR1_ARATH|nr:debranching enzyme 1 [Arabidopsis thaliana]Q94K01.1 RecName: Full=Lariat debranching enzyme; Short=AtDBR1 [Arabidopsis thaliana]KAG7618063.1 Lariat debranching enzyme C-terminal [Arabidopsis thaliana x Arabidopsis arenosa]KAG7622524.1 Lariat debranching enzyme C-terminal [Arabidopsis suecica]AAK43876.1 RNA lariat debranching enzyme - like protein [Arabidopsis thaliana]ABI54338.1 At4g31770 [Arabidopsis thaliana]AEE85955.1 debranching enzyme 1 [Arabidopsis thaliana]|eukprot:NP_567881.1 debranching enzyme 1 [Arabidopsis thaliana]